jgi:signal peptidase I
METLGLSPSTPKPTSRIRELFWPKIEDEVAAVTAARNAMYACLFIAAIIGISGLVAGQNAWILLDVLLFTMAGIGVRQLSRAAAITALLMYALEWLGVGGFSVLRPILLAILLGGVRAAAFAHHMKSEVREAIANPAMDTTTMSRIGILLEELPRRAWPAIHGPFLAALGLLVAVNLIAVNSLLFGQFFAIPTSSMEPTIYRGDRVFVLHRIFSGTIRRGDVVAVRDPVDTRQSFLKRVVGLPGDRLKLVNKNLWVNGKEVNEPYVVHATEYIDPYRDNFPSVAPPLLVAPEAGTMLSQNVRNGEIVVPPEQYFLLGDNRDESLDSRYWGFAGNGHLEGRSLLVVGKGNRSLLRYPLGE